MKPLYPQPRWLITKQVILDKTQQGHRPGYHLEPEIVKGSMTYPMSDEMMKEADRLTMKLAGAIVAASGRTAVEWTLIATGQARDIGH
jgi:hypothetical protein